LPVPRYRLTLAYDGSAFHGWQKQEPVPAQAGTEGAGPPTPLRSRGIEHGLAAAKPGRIALRTVQGVLERAVREVVREPIEVMGASRTDAGVHARGQIAAFTCSEGVEAGEGWPQSRGMAPLVRALNGRLPGDVLVLDACAVAASFDPVGDAVEKGYTYTLHVSRDRPLFDRHLVQHVWVPLDLESMRAAAARLVGEHDFAGFAAAGHGRGSTVRTIFSCDVVRAGDAPGWRHADPAGRSEPWATRLRIDISGSGFLYNMVRIIAGTLVEVGRGRIEPGAIGEILASRDRARAGPTLPPTGLCLEWVKYGSRSEPLA
jgi:tRNA pseudouridine38-40 synthase